MVLFSGDVIINFGISHKLQNFSSDRGREIGRGRGRYREGEEREIERGGGGGGGRGGGGGERERGICRKLALE